MNTLNHSYPVYAQVWHLFLGHLAHFAELMCKKQGKYERRNGLIGGANRLPYLNIALYRRKEVTLTHA